MKTNAHIANRRTPLALCVAVGAGLILWAGLRPQDDSRLSQLTRVRGVPGRGIVDSVWLSDRELLVYRREGEVVDVTDGTSRQVRAFGDEGAYTRTIQASPDEKRLLWPNDTSAGAQWTVAAHLGSEIVRRPRTTQDRYPRAFAWLPDSTHWVEFALVNNRTHALIYGIDVPGVTDIPLALPSPPNGIVRVTPQGTVIASITGVSGYGSDGVDLMEFPLKAGAVPLRIFSALQPRLTPFEWGRRSYECALSRDGKRAAWLFNLGEQQSMLALLRSLLFPHASHAAAKTYCIWVSNLDGTGAREVVPRFTPQGGAYRLEWLPGNSRLSFYYDNEVWIVPAEGQRAGANGDSADRSITLR